MANETCAAWLCTGCGLGEAFDFGQFEAVVRKEAKIPNVRRHEMLCGAQGVQAIRDDIVAQALTQVVIAACSRRAKTEAFRFPEVALARANLREGVLWAVAPGTEHDEIRQEMADDYLRMACAEVKKMKLPGPNPEAASNRRVLVVGGGITGMTAALEVADTGYEAVIVEKAAELGGWAGRLHRRVPDRAPYEQPQPTGVAELVARVKAHPLVTVLVGATLAETSGGPGRFTVRIARESGTPQEETFGAIVQATGFATYPIEKLPELGGGGAHVVDQAGLEALARAAGDGPIRRADGREVRSVVFVQCAGQRDATGAHLPYCSGHCCATSIKQAMYFKGRDPSIDTVVAYTELRVPGMGEDFYRSAQRQGVTFAKADVTGVESGAERSTVRLRDLILDEDTTIAADLVVLATGQVPESGVDIDAPADAAAGGTAVGTPAGAAVAAATRSAAAAVVAQPISILNLSYRQGRDLPKLRHGFTDSHFICFPYESRRTGIYAAGPVRRPMDIAQARTDAAGAALKAIQAIENAAAGRAAHPRSGDLSYPKVRLEGCTQCKRCTVECPFGAIDEDERRFPKFNLSRCRRCGTCMGACPVRVISFDNYSVDTVGSQIKAVEIPDEFSEKPRILVLACENDAYPALDMAGMARIGYSAFVRVIPVRCLGSVNTIWITDALNGGYDGVMMMGCKKGDDYQCHFVKGSELAFYRMSKIDDTLKQLGLEKERVTSCEVAITDARRVAQLIDDYAAQIREIGLSPMKGFG